MASSDIIAENSHAWEINPSTRTSVGLWTKYVNVDSTLTMAGTAEDIYATTSALEPTVNIATNPSMETADPPTGYTTSGATLTRSNTVARNGTYSLSVNPDNAAAGEGAYWTSPILGSGIDPSNQLYLIVSAYFQDNVDSGDGARIMVRNSSGVALATGNSLVLSSSWQRSFVAHPLNQTGAAVRVYFETVLQHNTTFYVDGFQAEIRRGGSPSTYCDGSIGLNYEWFGTAHASMSRRRKGVFAIRGFDLHFTRDTYIAFDHTASSSTGTFIRAGTDWSPEHPLHYIKNISFINVNTGEKPRIWGALHGVHTGENQG